MKRNYLESSLRGLHSWIAKCLETLRLPARISSFAAWVILLLIGIFFFALVAVATVIWFLLASRDPQDEDESVDTHLFSPSLRLSHPEDDPGHPDYVAAGDDYLGASWCHTEIVDMNKLT